MVRRFPAILALILLVAGASGARLLHQVAAHGDGRCHAAARLHGANCTGSSCPHLASDGADAAGASTHDDDRNRSTPGAHPEPQCDTCDWLALATGPLSDPPLVPATVAERVGDSPIVLVRAPVLRVLDATRARPPPAA